MKAIGVVGAGTMGAGIGQLAALAGYETLLSDPSPEALARAEERIRAGLAKGAAKGRWSSEAAEGAAGRLRRVDGLAGLASADLVIEAAPEDLELKRRLFAELDAICGPDAILATNTSSIPVTAIAAATEDPGRVVGMHFFNPPPLMPLVEVIPGLETSDRAVSVAREAAERFGKHVIVAKDVPGFLVNRCGRPLYGEGLRLLTERVGTVEQIDRACRVGAGFRMGPFELMDLVGIDVAFDVARSFFERSFGEPRWRPNPLQETMVMSGNLGRKTGRGWYGYGPEEPQRSDPEPPEPRGAAGTTIAVLGAGPEALAFARLAREAGISVEADPGVGCDAAFVFDAPDGARPEGVPLALWCADRSLASWGVAGAVGFTLPGRPGHRYAELTGPGREGGPGKVIADVLASLGLLVEWVGDGPGLLLGRILVQVANEGAFALAEGIGSAAEIDDAGRLGLNYPVGSISLGEEIGWATVLARLDGIWSERREERYRPAPGVLAMTNEED